jgi:hypothetical protein
MLEGLWIIRFHGPAGSGGGVVVFTKGKILGGDNGFAFFGPYEAKGDSITGKVFVKNFEPEIPSVFGLPGDYEITLDAKVVKEGMIEGSAGIAAFPDTKIVFHGTLLYKL